MEAPDTLRRAQRALASFETWLERQVEPVAKAPFPLELAAWRRELGLIRGLLEQSDRVRIALIGTTGAGKSTFLNAVLGQEVLPVGVMQPCTAFVTAVSYSPGSEYRVTVQFCSAEEWRTDLEGLVAALAPGDVDDSGEARGESKRLVDAARKRIQAVYNLQIDDSTDVASILSANLPLEAELVFAAGSEDSRRFQTEKEMQAYLRKLIRGESALWPLVKQVSVSGPYACLAGGLELIDLPGLNDPNEARVEVTRDFLRTSPFVWVVFPMVRGLTDDVRRILGEERLLRTLVLSGSYGALSLVGTKADDIDMNAADQLGLPDDCSQGELIQAYRNQTVTEARGQLEEMVRDLALGADGGETLERMIGIARRARIHTTSASAYNKLQGIGRLRKDYGLSDPTDTGIPGIHEHLLEIGKEAGVVFNADTALKRLDYLRDEMAFFFRAKAQAATPEVEQARVRFQQEREAFSQAVRTIQSRASDQLRIYRQQFVQKVDPLLAASVRGVEQTAQEWRAIHWATLRATVQRNGFYKSPTTARTYDLNTDLAEPLLRQLPVSWERYFTDDMERVTTEFVLTLTEAGKTFCGRVRLIVELLFNRQDRSVEGQLAWFQDKLASSAQASKGRVIAAVRERRGELAAKMPLVARDTMLPAYDASKAENGSGMKRRILGHLEPAAVSSAQPMYSSIQSDLLEGLSDLEFVVAGMLRELSSAAEEQARQVAHNANIDVDEAGTDPVVSALLSSAPAW